MNKLRINEIKGDAFSFVMGLPMHNSIFFTLDTEERKCWEDGYQEAIEFSGAIVGEIPEQAESFEDTELDAALISYVWDILGRL